MLSSKFAIAVRKTLDPKAVKKGLRQITTTNRVSNITGAIIRLNLATQNVIHVANPVLRGFIITPEDRKQMEGAFGPVLKEIALLSRLLKHPLIGSSKAVSLEAETHIGALLELNSLSLLLQENLMQVLDGGEFVEDKKLLNDLDKITIHTWGTIRQVLGVPVAEVMENYVKNALNL